MEWSGICAKGWKVIPIRYTGPEPIKKTVIEGKINSPTTRHDVDYCYDSTEHPSRFERGITEDL
jgi:hypothetical protein